MEPGDTPEPGSPLTSLLHDCVERVLASWERLEPGASPPPGALRRFFEALANFERSAAALSSGSVSEGVSTEAGLQHERRRPSDARFAEVDGARSYAHLAGLLPRALERVISFDAAAAVIRRLSGELVIDVSSEDPALSEVVRQRALQLHQFLIGGIEGPETAVPPPPMSIRSGLYLPLVADGAVVGTTYVASTREHAFTEEDERVLIELASHASRAFARVEGGLRALRATPRQSQVLALVAAGLSDKEIADKLGVSPRTVRTHLERVRREHGLTSRTEAATAFLRGHRS